MCTYYAPGAVLWDVQIFSPLVLTATHEDILASAFLPLWIPQRAVLKTLKQIHTGAHIGRNWGLRPTTIRVSHLGSESFLCPFSLPMTTPILSFTTSPASHERPRPCRPEKLLQDSQLILDIWNICYFKLVNFEEMCHAAIENNTTAQSRNHRHRKPEGRQREEAGEQLGCLEREWIPL